MNRKERIFEIARHLNLLMLDSSSADEIEQLRICLRIMGDIRRQAEVKGGDNA